VSRHEATGRSRHEHTGRSSMLVRLGVILEAGVADPADDPALTAEVSADLAATYPGLSWEVAVTRAEIGDPTDNSLDLLELARDRMLDEGWNLVVGISQEPLRQGSHSLTAQISPVHAAGVVSLDREGAELPGTIRRTVAGILGLPPGDRPPSARQLRSAIRAARQLASDVEDRGAEHRGRFAWRVLTANPRLILRTVHAHQPWLLAASLSRSMSAGLATGALTLITTDLWLLSAEYTGTQLALLGAVAILAVTIALVVGSDLWERPRRHAEREQAVVFNIATLVSVLIGVTVLYIALFLAALAGAVLLVDADVFGQITGDPAHPVHFLKLAWFVGGLATIGSALGAGLEDDDDVRAALFTRASASRRGRPSPMAGEHEGPHGDDV